MVPHVQVLFTADSATKQTIHVTSKGAGNNTSAGVGYMSAGVRSSISAGIRNILWCVALRTLEITLKDMKLLWVQSLLLHWCWGTKCVSCMSARCVKVFAHAASCIWVVIIPVGWKVFRFWSKNYSVCLINLCSTEPSNTDWYADQCGPSSV